MEIKIEHIAKIEGHAGFVAHILKGNIIEARLEIEQGKRFMEKVIEGRKYDEVPIICSRICGICPVVHQITSIRALEKALEIQPSEEVIRLRKIMLALQIIQSHTLHLFILSQEKDIIPIRDFTNGLLSVIGGRSIHPITPCIGGFTKFPERKEINKLMKNYNHILDLALRIAPKFRNQPSFERKTEFWAADDIYDGTLPSIKANVFMLGAIARINLYFDKLNPLAKELVDFEVPSFNPFMNIYAQAVEIVHFLEETKENIEKLQYKDNTMPSVPVKESQGTAFCEAPRGILSHSYQIDKEGYIKKAEIVTPTFQFIPNLEADLKEYLKDTQDEEKIKSLIRAYDPCISCAVR